MIDVQQIDNFLADPDAVRSAGLRANYQDMLLKDGQVYKRVAPAVIPAVMDALQTAMGRPVELEAMGFRLNYDNEMPNRPIHSDAGWGTYAMVLYLTPDDVLLRYPEPTGTMLWTHKSSGTQAVRDTDIDLLVELVDDWDDTSKWEPRQLLRAKYNTASIYRTDLYHSRWPLEAFGTSPGDGRLTLVAFFS